MCICPHVCLNRHMGTQDLCGHTHTCSQGTGTKACVCGHASVFASPVLDDWPGESGVAEPGRWGAGREETRNRSGTEAGAKLGLELERAGLHSDCSEQLGCEMIGKQGQGAQEGCCAVVILLLSKPLGGDVVPHQGDQPLPTTLLQSGRCLSSFWFLSLDLSVDTALQGEPQGHPGRLPCFLLLWERQTFSRNKTHTPGFVRNLPIMLFRRAISWWD